MGTWNTSVTGNDTAKDLYIEYTAAFYKFDVEEALKRIDSYIRTEMFDESDEEEWCNYIYSLADFMWKKGILTDSIRNKAIEMIDSGFGLELWQEAGQKTFDSRKKKLTEFKEKLLSPQPPKKKIKPNVHTERIFDDGDIIAVQLQTVGKPYTEQESKAISEEDFHNFDGKYVLMQLVNCYASWTSSIVPEVKDYWACFRLFDGIYDTVPNDVDLLSLKDALIHQGQKISSIFTCESNMFYFKRRGYKVICNRKDLLSCLDTNSNNSIFWGSISLGQIPIHRLLLLWETKLYANSFRALLNKLSISADTQIDMAGLITVCPEKKTRQDTSRKKLALLKKSAKPFRTVENCIVYPLAEKSESLHCIMDI